MKQEELNYIVEAVEKKVTDILQTSLVAAIMESPERREEVNKLIHSEWVKIILEREASKQRIDVGCFDCRYFTVGVRSGDAVRVCNKGENIHSVAGCEIYRDKETV